MSGQGGPSLWKGDTSVISGNVTVGISKKEVTVVIAKKDKKTVTTTISRKTGKVTQY